MSSQYVTKGDSMVPFIKQGDLVAISEQSNFLLGFARVAAFIHPATGEIVIHRIIGKRSNAYLFKADAYFRADGWIGEKSILGRVDRIERNGTVIYSGLGWERFFIALLSRSKVLFLILKINNLIKRLIK